MTKNKLTFVCDTVIATCLRSTDIMIPARAKMLLRVFFYGRKAHEGKNNTRLLFNSNLHGNICCFARQKGLFSKYGKDFKNNGRQVNLPVTERLEFLKMLRHDIYHLGMGIDIDDGEWKEKYVDNRVETVYNKKQRNFLQEQLPFMNNGETLFIPTNAIIKSATVIAGNGSDTVLRKKEWLAETYGGNAEEWKKCVGKIESDKYLIDVHCYELGKKQYGAKVKFVKEK